jgi:hypothetical protein
MQARPETASTLATLQARSLARVVSAVSRDAGLHGVAPTTREGAIAWVANRLALATSSALAGMRPSAERVTRLRMALDGAELLNASADAATRLRGFQGLAYAHEQPRRSAVPRAAWPPEPRGPMFGPFAHANASASLEIGGAL